MSKDIGGLWFQLLDSVVYILSVLSVLTSLYIIILQFQILLFFIWFHVILIHLISFTLVYFITHFIPFCFIRYLSVVRTRSGCSNLPAMPFVLTRWTSMAPCCHSLPSVTSTARRDFCILINRYDAWRMEIWWMVLPANILEWKHY